MRAAVIYARLSASADDSVSIARQEAELRAYADREGWPVRAVIVDDGISGTKARANAQRALKMLRDGEAQVLLVWALDRFSRQGLSAVAELVETLDASPGALFVALKDGLRSDMAMWRVIAVVLAEVARSEAEATSARRRSEIAFRRGHGRHTGGSPPFGYRAVDVDDGLGQTLEHDPVEVELICRLAEDILEGKSLTRLTRELNQQKVPTGRSPARAAARKGKPTEGLDCGVWEPTTLKRLLSSDRLLGRMSHNGRTITGDDGLPVEFFPPILSLATVERLRVRLRPNGPAPVHRRKARLLSTVAFCAHCDKRMWVTQRRGKDVYRCGDYSATGCPSPTAPAEALEDYVSSMVLSVAGDWPEVVEVVEDTGA